MPGPPYPSNITPVGLSVDRRPKECCLHGGVCVARIDGLSGVGADGSGGRMRCASETSGVPRNTAFTPRAIVSRVSSCGSPAMSLMVARGSLLQRWLEQVA